MVCTFCSLSCLASFGFTGLKLFCSLFHNPSLFTSYIIGNRYEKKKTSFVNLVNLTLRQWRQLRRLPWRLCYHGDRCGHRGRTPGRCSYPPVGQLVPVAQWSDRSCSLYWSLCVLKVSVKDGNLILSLLPPVMKLKKNSHQNIDVHNPSMNLIHLMKFAKRAKFILLYDLCMLSVSCILNKV